MKEVKKGLMAAIAFAAMLTSCGGGGGSESEGSTNAAAETTTITLSGGQFQNPFTAPPSSCTIVSPADASVGLGLTPTFTWTAATEVETYTLQIDTDSGFTLPLEFEATLIDPSATSYGLSAGAIYAGRKYFWRVLAVNPLGQTPASNAPFSFATSGWANRYGGTVGFGTNSMTVADDGGYVMAGTTHGGQGDGDLWICKTDSNGNILWQKSCGHTGAEYATAIAKSTDGSYYVTGNYFVESQQNYDGWLLKVDDSGNILWQQTIGAAGIDNLNSVAATANGGIACGQIEIEDPILGTVYNFWVVKFDRDGTIQWQTAYGGQFCWAKSIAATSDGGYVVAGTIANEAGDDYDGLVLKLDSTGAVTWGTRLGTLGIEFLNSAIDAGSNSYIVAGTTDPTLGSWIFDAMVVKLDSTGAIVWQNSYSGAGTESSPSIITTSNGLFMALETDSFGTGGYDIQGMKLDTVGTIVWQKVYGTSKYDVAASQFSAAVTSDQFLVLAGSSATSMSGVVSGMVIKVATDGSLNEGYSSGITSSATSSTTQALSLTVTSTSPSITDTSSVTTMQDTSTTTTTANSPAQVE